MSNNRDDKPLMNNEELISRIVDRLKATDDKIDQRFDFVESRLHGIDTTILRNAMSLEEHMRRTDLLERAVINMEARFSPIETERIQKDAVKKHKHESLVRWGKIAAAVIALGTILAALKPLILLLLAGA